MLNSTRILERDSYYVDYLAVKANKSLMRNNIISNNKKATKQNNYCNIADYVYESLENEQ